MKNRAPPDKAPELSNPHDLDRAKFVQSLQPRVRREQRELHCKLGLVRLHTQATR